MERKIGEIFEYKGEWYQCVNTGFSCADCDIKADCSDMDIGACSSSLRTDRKKVVFKKLEKVGEPYEYYVSKKGIINVQDYLLAAPNHTIYNKIEGVYDYLDDKVVIELKQNQENMEEKKNEELSNLENTGKNLKPFDLEAARSGKPVCTRDGRKARIICFDAKGDKPIIALVEMGTAETPNNYPIDGKAVSAKEASCDLMMLPEKKEGWVNVIKNQDNYYYCKGVFDTEEYARNNEANYPGLAVATVKIEWEE